MERFLSNKVLWGEIQKRASRARRIRAAVAYLGTNAARFLHLKPRDTLVVDMSVGAVKQGVTNPTEVAKLLKRGVKVFSRPNLHAKVLVLDNAVIASSANASVRSFERLDEAGCLTTDRVAVERANEFIDSIATDLVLPKYLRRCISLYRRPRFLAARDQSEGERPRKRRRARPADLWFVGGLVYIELPEAEKGRVKAAEKRARKQVRWRSSEVDWLRYRRQPAWTDALRLGDLVVYCIKDKHDRRHVSAPARFLGVESYARGRDKSRYLVMLERSPASEDLSFGEFRRRLGSRPPFDEPRPPRTRGISDVALADRIRGIWTPSGKVSRRRP